MLQKNAHRKRNNTITKAMKYKNTHTTQKTRAPETKTNYSNTNNETHKTKTDQTKSTRNRKRKLKLKYKQYKKTKQHLKYEETNKKNCNKKRFEKTINKDVFKNMKKLNKNNLTNKS